MVTSGLNPDTIDKYRLVSMHSTTLLAAQTPRNNQVFVAVCSGYWNGVHICISESIMNISSLRNQMI